MTAALDETFVDFGGSFVWDMQHVSVPLYCFYVFVEFYIF